MAKKFKCKMKAMILAAGLGTRLRPLTNNKPKALVEVKGRPLLQICIERLMKFGVKDIIVNVHHFAEQIEAFLKEQNHFEINLKISDERTQLLETGGGVRKASWFFEDGAPFLLCNADILTDLDIKHMYEQHCAKEDALVSLAVSNRESSRYLLFDEQNILCGWMNTKTKEVKISRKNAGTLHMKAFSGVHIIDPKIFELMPAKEQPYSIIQTYLAASKEFNIFAHPHQALWLDVGRKSSLDEAQKLIDKLN